MDLFKPLLPERFAIRTSLAVLYKLYLFCCSKFCYIYNLFAYLNLLKVPKEERGEVERLEKLVNKYERGQIQRVDWLDRLAFKAMDKIKERENSKNGSSHLYVVVDFSSFEHRVVFQVNTLSCCQEIMYIYARNRGSAFIVCCI